MFQTLRANDLIGPYVPARVRLGNAKCKPIETAPGRYVMVRGD